MNDSPAFLPESSYFKALKWKISEVLPKYKRWRTERMLKQIVSWSDSNCINHARRELIGCKENSEEMDKLMAEQVIQLLAVFGTHGHSGFSAPFAINLFKNLAAFKPLSPLTGEDSEWNLLDYEDGTKYQNNRASHVFKDDDGKAYDIDGKVFVEPNGCSYTNRDSRVYITFPYSPKTEYVNVPAPEA